MLIIDINTIVISSSTTTNNNNNNNDNHNVGAVLEQQLDDGQVASKRKTYGYRYRYR